MKPKQENKMCQRHGPGEITVYSETHKQGLGLLLLNLHTVRTDFCHRNVCHQNVCHLLVAKITEKAKQDVKGNAKKLSKEK